MANVAAETLAKEFEQSKSKEALLLMSGCRPLVLSPDHEVPPHTDRDFLAGATYLGYVSGTKDIPSLRLAECYCADLRTIISLVPEHCAIEFRYRNESAPGPDLQYLLLSTPSERRTYGVSRFRLKKLRDLTTLRGVSEFGKTICQVRRTDLEGLNVDIETVARSYECNIPEKFDTTITLYGNVLHRLGGVECNLAKDRARYYLKADEILRSAQQWSEKNAPEVGVRQFLLEEAKSMDSDYSELFESVVTSLFRANAENGSGSPAEQSLEARIAAVRSRLWDAPIIKEFIEPVIKEYLAANKVFTETEQFPVSICWRPEGERLINELRHSVGEGNRGQFLWEKLVNAKAPLDLTEYDCAQALGASLEQLKAWKLEGAVHESFQKAVADFVNQADELTTFFKTDRIRDVVREKAPLFENRSAYHWIIDGKIAQVVRRYGDLLNYQG
jgi:hypothetical protein